MIVALSHSRGIFERNDGKVWVRVSVKVARTGQFAAWESLRIGIDASAATFMIFPSRLLVRCA